MESIQLENGDLENLINYRCRCLSNATICWKPSNKKNGVCENHTNGVLIPLKQMTDIALLEIKQIMDDFADCITQTQKIICIKNFFDTVTNYFWLSINSKLLQSTLLNKLDEFNENEKIITEVNCAKYRRLIHPKIYDSRYNVCHNVFDYYKILLDESINSDIQNSDVDVDLPDCDDYESDLNIVVIL
jgi:hypothetical protein